MKLNRNTACNALILCIYQRSVDRYPNLVSCLIGSVKAPISVHLRNYASITFKTMKIILSILVYSRLLSPFRSEPIRHRREQSIPALSHPSACQTSRCIRAITIRPDPGMPIACLQIAASNCGKSCRNLNGVLGWQLPPPLLTPPLPPLPGRSSWSRRPPLDRLACYIGRE